MPQMHKCGKCESLFETENDYVDHACPETGLTPKEAEHHGGKYVDVQAAAMARGEKRKVEDQ